MVLLADLGLDGVDALVMVTVVLVAVVVVVFTWRPRASLQDLHRLVPQQGR